MLLVAAALVFAGCIGGSGSDAPAEPQGGADDGGTDTGSSADDGGGSQDGADDGGASGDDGSSDGDDDASDAPRTPDQAMPGYGPAETGEDWARYEIEGTADFSISIYALRAEMDDTMYNLTVRKDVERVEAVLTWESEFSDLNLHLVNDRGQRVLSSAHGMVATDPVGSLPLITPNGTTWEYLTWTTDQEATQPGEYNLEVSEWNNWDPEAAAGNTPASDGLSYALTVWVSTTPTEPANRPA